MATITVNNWAHSHRILICLFLMKKWVYDLTKWLFQHEENALKRVNSIYLCTALSNFHAFI